MDGWPEHMPFNLLELAKACSAANTQNWSLSKWEALADPRVGAHEGSMGNKRMVHVVSQDVTRLQPRLTASELQS